MRLTESAGTPTETRKPLTLGDVLEWAATPAVPGEPVPALPDPNAALIAELRAVLDETALNRDELVVIEARLVARAATALERD